MLRSPRLNPVAEREGNHLPGILLTFAPITSFMAGTTRFYPASLGTETKHQMAYPGDRPGYMKGTRFVTADYQWAAQNALEHALHAKGTPQIEVVTLKLERVEKDLNWLDMKARYRGEASSVHAGDAPAQVLEAVREQEDRRLARR
jgi:hypothetical protein